MGGGGGGAQGAGMKGETERQTRTQRDRCHNLKSSSQRKHTHTPVHSYKFNNTQHTYYWFSILFNKYANSKQFIAHPIKFA